ncbi:MAG TPA: HAD-IA family hydrolase [archaeon]|nr:HAD-IA family hydrolase [archaeon]
MIKAIFLDLEGVVTHNGRILTDGVYRHTKNYLTKKQVLERYKKARTGKLSYEEFFRGVPKNKRDDFLKEVFFHKGSKTALEKLCKKYPLYLASNHIDILFEKEINKLKIKKYFKKIFVSKELKTRKPFLKFYKTILKKTNLKGNETIFVDDTKRNLKGAKKCKMITIQMVNPEHDDRNKIDFRADFEIKDLNELEKIIKKINN